MDYQDYIESEPFQANYNIFVEEFRKIHNWSEASIKTFYNQYTEFIGAGKVLEVKANETAGYYAKLKNDFMRNSELSYSYNFIDNFVDAYINSFAVPEVIAQPMTWYLKTKQTSQRLGIGENQLGKAWNKTLNLFKDSTKRVIGFVVDETKQVIGGLGEGIGNAMQGILKPEVIIIIVIGAVLYFFLTKKK